MKEDKTSAAECQGCSPDMRCMVRFHNAGKAHSFVAKGMNLKKGERVVVETDSGVALGKVVALDTSAKGDKKEEKKILRPANDEDLAREQRNMEREVEAFRYCAGKIAERSLPMKLLKVEYTLDNSKATFYFYSEKRVDFRELVKDLARQFNTRIEMKQIGVRDCTKLLGGIGPCGRELCCGTWLVDFVPVSLKMAKEQNLSPNPQKLSGICGRLKCCLAYEYQVYSQIKAMFPRVGSRVETDKGCGKITKQDLMRFIVTVSLDNGIEVDAKVPESMETANTPLKTIKTRIRVEESDEEFGEDEEFPRENTIAQVTTGEAPEPVSGESEPDDSGEEDEGKEGI